MEENPSTEETVVKLTPYGPSLISRGKVNTVKPPILTDSRRRQIDPCRKDRRTGEKKQHQDKRPDPDRSAHAVSFFHETPL
jgi:hypothetical protein